VTLAFVVACGDDDSFRFEGTPGTLVDVTLTGNIPLVTGRVAGAEGRFLVDTGAPFTILDKDSFAGLEDDGPRRVDLAAFELSFPGYQAISYDFFAGVGEGLPDGLIGGDLLSHFAFWTDYQGARAGLFEGGDAPELDPARVGPLARLGFLLEGGGPAPVPGNCPPEPFCGQLDLPPTRVLLRARLEGSDTPIHVLVDSGASATATHDFFLATLAEDPARPRLDGIQLLTAGGAITAAMTRFSRTRLVGIDDDRAGVDVDDMPVLVLPIPTLFDQLSRELGVRVDVLVGATYLREFTVGIDYPAEELGLARYVERSHIPADEWIGPGFALAPVGDRWVVEELYARTDAEAEGLRRGDEVTVIEGTPITGLPGASVEALLDGHAVGDELAVTYVVMNGETTTLVSVEDLLPSFPFSEGP
jgi:hypothetical protein